MLRNEKIAIIGGGIPGLCTALALQQKGVHAEVYDRNDQNNKYGTGIVLGENALQCLEYFGLKKRIQEIGLSAEKCTIYSEIGKSLANLTYQSSTSKFLSVPVDEFKTILMAALIPGTVHFQKNVNFFIETDDGIQISFGDHTRKTMDYLIACDGANSFIRTKLFPDLEPQYTGLSSWNGIIDWDEEIGKVGYSETWGPHGIFGIVPLQNNKIYWYAIKKCNQHENYKNWNSLDLLFNFFSYHEPIQTILEKQEDQPLYKKDLFKLDLLQQYLYGRILLLGEAGNVCPSNLDQFSSQAIEDAYALSNTLSSEVSLGEAFKEYEKQSLGRNMRISADMDRLYKMAQLDKPALCSIRNKLFKLVPDRFHEKKLKSIFGMETCQ
ncbi:FAD-dependent monooxygenase [Bacillus sp. B15-48]|uniref:FAD-dependent monooxygenase n=1 Tax=Bacillus sp. B15-48 TaxID=1548601 RepID=UPI00193FCF45|nr:FAD-dependent monooxygenase [Bacillus sp. B15-48]MBM4760718.1 hypothetical protein [Bacillus sp. B15-48]